jgi:hypothetical protein
MPSGGGLARIERIAGRAVDAVGGVAAGAELGRVGLGEDDAAGLADVGDAQLVLARHVTLEQQRAPGGGEARRRLQVLDGNRQPRQQARLGALAHRLFGGLGASARRLDVERDDGVDGAVGLLDALDAAVEQLDWREHADADQPPCRDR